MGKTQTSKYTDRIKQLVLPAEVKEMIDTELEKFSYLDPNSSEHAVTRSHLDWLTTVPWGIYTPDKIDLTIARNILETDHHGIPEVKQRIIEFLAVQALKGSNDGKIICLVGPPGVGKTSVGKSVARALGRKFTRVAVGGLDEISEVKGHRRTFIGAMPGQIIRSLKQAKVANPVFMLDEIDKLSSNYRGNPSAALLEVLDAEQNNQFLDLFLDVPCDLSKILFICTANTTESIPAPLLDRMEIINMPSYTSEEKYHIAKKHLIPAARKNSGLKGSQVSLKAQSVRSLINGYCREAGVRTLNQHIERIHRKIACEILEQKETSVTISDENLADYVGKKKFSSHRYYEKTIPGVVMGLAYTAYGGQTLYIETIAEQSDDKGSLKTTGNMQLVMVESSTIAYTYARVFFQKLQPENNFFKNAVINLHSPDGAIPKDGPSAGSTMTLAFISLALGIPVPADFTMTGEITLTGKILKIGGVKEKVIAAKGAKAKTVVLPFENKPDWDELDDYLKKNLNVKYVSYFSDVFNIAFPNIKLPDTLQIPETEIVKTKEEDVTTNSK